MARRKRPATRLKLNTKEIVNTIQHTAAQRMWEATQVVRNQVLETLSGERTGREYKIPGTNATYTASAPGEAPAVQLGTLRKTVKTEVTTEKGGRTVVGRVGSDQPYARRLEFGFMKTDSLGRKYAMAPRPWLEPSFQKALPEVKKILSRRWM